MFMLQLGGWFIFSCILMSFVEHQVHRKLMHRSNFLSTHNVVFPLADYVLGTSVRTNDGDLKDMERWGL